MQIAEKITSKNSKMIVTAVDNEAKSERAFDSTTINTTINTKNNQNNKK